MRFKNIAKRFVVLAIMGLSIIGLAACGGNDTSKDDTESTASVESTAETAETEEETTTVEPETVSTAEEWIGQANEWAENIYQLLITEDYEPLITTLSDIDSVKENVAGYEYDSDSAKYNVQYEGAYIFAAADGTVFGIVIEESDDQSTWTVNAFVSDDTEYGFLAISVGNSHYIWVNSTGAYAYLKDKIYYVYDSDGSQEVYEWDDDAGIVIWQ